MPHAFRPDIGFAPLTTAHLSPPGAIRMKSSIVLLLLLATTTSAVAQKPSNEGFVLMFDGRTLDGWEETPVRTEKAWSVKDGMIVGEGNKGGRGYLVYRDRDVANFEMKLSYRFPNPGHANSGVNIRARKDKTGRRDFQSYHADIGHAGIGRNVLGAWDFHTPGRKEHGCSRGNRLVIDKNDQAHVTPIENAVQLSDIHRNNWNEMHIIAQDKKFSFYLNGKLSAEFEEHLPEERCLHSGMIQLQLHDPGMVVHFRDLKLKVLE